MPSQYLIGADLVAYGVGDATTAQIVQASNVIDAHLGRPEGIVWAADYRGIPCYMVGPTATFSTTIAAGVPAGANVTVTSPALAVFPDIVGHVVVLDRANTGIVEAATVVSNDLGAGTVTLDNVTTAHAANCTADLGLSIFEERALAPKRSIARISRAPAVRLQSGIGRYGYGRRSDQSAGLYNDVNLLATIQSFGGPPQWIPFDITACSYSQPTGEVWVPAGLLLAYYSEVRLRYIAGWSAANLPAPIKQACANLVVGMGRYPQMQGNIQQLGAKSGVGADSQTKRFSASAVDDDTKRLLAPYRADLLA